MNITKLLVSILFLVMSSQVSCKEVFKTGPVFAEYGRHAKVEHNAALDATTKLKVVFDVAEAAAEQKLNRRFDSLARFINMHVANGVLLENIHLALVVHGEAGQDLLHNKAYQARNKTENPSAAIVNALLKNKVDIYLCGQSAAYHQINANDLIGGVQMSLSAMTAHALLNRQGYSLNPF
ncbi:DsrE family protein [Aliiglaciecola litoralis]|uniref:Intracellular sulfur oxidation protein, DsrE/DsrF family n=1 Tax=Aliiglaciecola litoralis TaxID=582857 RepID=A0ABP3WWC0_9ALTE